MRCINMHVLCGNYSLDYLDNVKDYKTRSVQKSTLFIEKLLVFRFIYLTDVHHIL